MLVATVLVGNRRHNCGRRRVVHHWRGERFQSSNRCHIYNSENRHSIISAVRTLSCSIIEAYFNHSYSAQSFTLPVYTAFNSSRTAENITTKSVDEVSHSHLNASEALGERIINIRSLHLNNSAYECIITTRSFRSMRNKLLSGA